MLDSCPMLKDEVLSYINEYINKATVETKGLIEKYLKAQMAFCNIHHWDLDEARFEGGVTCSPLKSWSTTDNDGSESNDATNQPPPNINENGFNNRGGDMNIEEMDTMGKNIIGKMKNDPNAKHYSRKLTSLIEGYMKLMQKQVADVSAKFIICFLVQAIAQFTKNDLILELMDSEKLPMILEDCETIYDERNRLVGMIEDVEEALVSIRSFCR